MPRELRVIDGGDAAAVFDHLRDALGGGPAILPRVVTGAATADSAAAPTPGPPTTVARRVAVVVETSGSTGAPKRVALSADALLAGTAASESALGGPGQWLLALPAHYIAGINVLARSLAAGTEPVLMPGGRFDPFAFAVAARGMDAESRLFTSLVPAQLARLIAEDDLLELLRGFDRILVGGQAIPQSLLERSLELGLNVTRTYGSSETAGGCVYDGIPLASTSIAIVDGQVELAGPFLAEGYLGDPERTDAAFVERNGLRWYRTGDLGEIRDGVLAVTGRADDVIISGGVKVSLGAVERVVRALPGLGDAVVVAAPSAEWGHVPVVVTTAAADASSVRAAVEAALGKAARPGRIIEVPELPLVPSGKPDRRALEGLAGTAG